MAAETTEEDDDVDDISSDNIGEQSKVGWEDDDFLSFNIEKEVDDEKDRNSIIDKDGNNVAEEIDNNNNDIDINRSGVPVPSYTRSVRETSTLPPWMSSFPPSGQRRINPLIALHNEIVDFTNLMSPLPEEIKEREDLVERVRAVAHSAFGTDECTVTLFGSLATGLLLPSSDIDLVIQFTKKESSDGVNKAAVSDKQKEKQEMENWDQRSPLWQLADALRHNWKEELTYLEVIENTRIPLVKFTHGPTDISVDVCFDQPTGPKAAELMKTYLNAMPPLRPLTIVLKYYMESRGINEPYTGGVGSFMLQLMIVSFLQHRERDQYNFNRPCLANLGCLLLEFFELYGLDFNYITTGISVRHDGFYFPKGAKEQREVFWQQSRPYSLALENPLEPTGDVGRSSFKIQTVQRSFEVAFNLLLCHVSEPYVPTISILASILPTTTEMKQRALLKRVDTTLSAPLSSERSMGRHQQNWEHSYERPPPRKRVRR